MKTRILGTGKLEVSALGLGCMGMTPIYRDPDPDEVAATLEAALDAGATSFWPRSSVTCACRTGLARSTASRSM